MIDLRTHQDLKDVLMEPRAKGVKDAYFILHGDNQNITILNPGKNGQEYNKTHGHFHTYQGIEIYHCLYGQGILVMQRNDEEGEAKEFKVVTLSAGRQVAIPAGFGHALVNVGKGYLVVLDNAPNIPSAHNYESIKEKQGLAYYVIDKRGDIAFVQNQSYKVHPQISSE